MSNELECSLMCAWFLYILKSFRMPQTHKNINRVFMKSLLSCGVAMENYKPYMAMIFVQFVYAGMALLSKAAISKGMNAYVFVVYRQAFATVALAPFACFLDSKKPSLSFSMVCKIFLVSLCGLTLSLNLYYVSINYVSATFAAATTNTIPVLTFIIAFFFRMETISIRQLHGIAKVLGSVISLSGALVFAFVKGPPLKSTNMNPAAQNQTADSVIKSDGNSIGDWVKGALIMLLANTAWSLWLVLQGAIVKQYPAKVRLTTLQCFFSCLQSACWAIVAERNPSAWKLGWNLHLISVAYCGVIVTGMTYWLQVWAIEKKGPVFTAIFTPLSLTITAIFSAFLWKETLHWGSVGGAVLLVGGLYSLLWGKKKEDRISAAANEQQNLDTKEDFCTLECITHH